MRKQVTTPAATEAPAPCQTYAITTRHFSGFSRRPWVVPLFGFFPPRPPPHTHTNTHTKEDFRGLKRSHPFEESEREHSEGLGRRPREGRTDNRVRCNELVATGAPGPPAEPGPRERCGGHTQCCPLEDEDAGALIRQHPPSSLGGHTWRGDASSPPGALCRETLVSEGRSRHRQVQGLSPCTAAHFQGKPRTRRPPPTCR